MQVSSFLNKSTPFPVTEMKERPEGHKIPAGSPLSLKTLEMSVSAKFKSANKMVFFVSLALSAFVAMFVQLNDFLLV